MDKYENKRKLTDKELEEIAENLNFDDSDIDSDLISNSDEDADEEDLIVDVSTKADHMNDDSDFNSSDDEPLVNLVPAGWLIYRKDAELQGLQKKDIIEYLDFKFLAAEQLLVQFPEISMEDQQRNANAGCVIQVEPESGDLPLPKKARKA
ncbi:hypothetical protein CBL_02968 [Carabus blaptoides fortunei]